MKAIAILIFVALSIFATGQNSIYDYSVPKIEGGSQPLEAYQGKKILIITLPLQHSAAADTMLYCLDTLAVAHEAELKIIATPSYEDGYTIEQKAQLNQWYRSKLGNNILITDGLYTRKTSGTQQHPLFKCLTSVSLNKIFDIDVDGPGYKFIVNSSGHLYGVLKPQTKISSRAVYRILQAQ